jgi:hypothetical protein
MVVSGGVRDIVAGGAGAAPCQDPKSNIKGYAEAFLSLVSDGDNASGTTANCGVGKQAGGGGVQGGQNATAGGYSGKSSNGGFDNLTIDYSQRVSADGYIKIRVRQ